LLEQCVETFGDFLQKKLSIFGDVYRKGKYYLKNNFHQITKLCHKKEPEILILHIKKQFDAKFCQSAKNRK
jgi:hypothetical protein